MTTPEQTTDPDWPAKAADKIVEVVGQVRDKSTKPAIKASRAIVFGVVIVFVGLLVLTLLLVGLFRLTTAIPGEVYWAYFIWGALLSLGGAILWTKRTA